VVAPKPPKAGLAAGAVLDADAAAPPKLNPALAGAPLEAVALVAGVATAGAAGAALEAPKENPPVAPASAGLAADEDALGAEADAPVPAAAPKLKPPLAGAPATAGAAAAAAAATGGAASAPAAAIPKRSSLSGSESISAILLRFSPSSKNTVVQFGSAETTSCAASFPAFCSGPRFLRRGLLGAPPSRSRFRCRRL
jgi:hypothetical protein